MYITYINILQLPLTAAKNDSVNHADNILNIKLRVRLTLIADSYRRF